MTPNAAELDAWICRDYWGAIRQYMRRTGAGPDAAVRVFVGVV